MNNLSVFKQYTGTLVDSSHTSMKSRSYEVRSRWSSNQGNSMTEKSVVS